ncbi:MAG: PAS domain-containing sensor histidine kinase [Candidatus Omnitrophica bacterium]|nr:PAS domain-containing sensor histidine kinase [Candidatus Omnitrophota bacterium]
MINRYKFKPGIKNAKISLELYADYMHDIIQSLREPLLILDSALRIKIANKSFYKTFRVRQRETENHLIQELGAGQWNIPELLELLRTVLVKKMGFEDYEIEHSFPDIGTKIMLLNACQIYHEAEATQTILLSMEDVTKQREDEKKLKQLNVVLEKRGLELERANEENKKLLKLKADFTAAVSHELRTPLTAIKESINIVYQGASGVMEEQKMFLEMAKRNVERLGRLVDNVLDFSKLESGKRKFIMVQSNINELIHEGGALYGVLATRKGLKIRYELQPEIPEIRFDYDSILQVLTNILSNALKFTEQGEIVICSKLLDGEIEVSVRDTGTGIRKKDMKMLFQPFEQVVSEGGKKAEGTGLGLTISKQIVEQHQGKISIDSTSGKGTLVRFTLPLGQNEVTAYETCLISS